MGALIRRTRHSTRIRESLILSISSLGDAMAEEQTKIVETVLEQIGSQVDLGITLATALAGGIAALVIQIALHNRSDGSRPLSLNHAWLIALAFFCEGASIVGGYLARSAMTDATPILLKLPESAWMKANKAISFGQITYDGAAALTGAVQFQAYALLAGLVAVFALGLLNFKKIM